MHCTLHVHVCILEKLIWYACKTAESVDPVPLPLTSTLKTKLITKMYAYAQLMYVVAVEGIFDKIEHQKKHTEVTSWCI